MARWKTTESIVQEGHVSLPAYAGRDEDPACADILSIASNDVRCDIGEVGIASCQQVWSGLAEQVLHALRDEEANGERQTKTSPSLLPFPYLESQNLRPVLCAVERRTRDAYKYDERDDDGWRKSAYYNE